MMPIPPWLSLREFSRLLFIDFIIKAVWSDEPKMLNSAWEQPRPAFKQGVVYGFFPEI